MPGIFSTGVQQVSSVNTTASVIFDIDNTSTTTYGALGSVTTGAVLTGVIINNTGTATMYVGQAAVSGTQGFTVPPGQSVIYSGSVTADISAVTASGTTSAEVGLATIQGAVV